MALPPVTNTPVSRALTGEREQRPANETPEPKSGDFKSSEDKVILSGEALRRLGQDSKIHSSDDARRAAGNVKAELSGNTDLTLGLDQDTSF